MAWYRYALQSQRESTITIRRGTEEKRPATRSHKPASIGKKKGGQAAVLKWNSSPQPAMAIINGSFLLVCLLQYIPLVPSMPERTGRATLGVVHGSIHPPKPTLQPLFFYQIVFLSLSIQR